MIQIHQMMEKEEEEEGLERIEISIKKIEIIVNLETCHLSILECLLQEPCLHSKIQVEEEDQLIN